MKNTVVWLYTHYVHMYSEFIQSSETLPCDMVAILMHKT